MNGVPSVPKCQQCPNQAKNMVVFKPLAGDYLTTSISLACDSPECLQATRLRAQRDHDASIIRLGKPAPLFHEQSAPQKGDHLPPHICALCRRQHHTGCSVDLIIRSLGKPNRVACECRLASHTLPAAALSNPQQLVP